MSGPDNEEQGTGSLSPQVAPRYARDIIRHVLTLLGEIGYAPKLLEQICLEVCEQLEEPKAPFDPEIVPYLTNLPQVMAYWNSDPRFKDARNQPLKLPLQTQHPDPSLEELIRRVFPDEDLHRVVRSLERVGAIRQMDGMYESLERFLILSRDPPAVLVHTMLAVAGIMRTVEYNRTKAESAPTLLERSARVPSIPTRLLPEIHARAKRDFDTQLWKFDSYVRSFEVPPGSEPTTCFGLGVYVFEDPLITGSAPTSGEGEPKP